MYSASDAFDTEVKKLSRTFCSKVLYSDDVDISDVVKSITVIAGSCGADSYSTGVAFSGYVTITGYGDLSALSGEELEVYIGLMVNGEAEYIRQGFFTIKPSDITKTKDSTTFTAYDRITSKCEAVTYESELSYPCDVGMVVDEIAEQADVTVIFSGFSNDVRDTEITDPIDTEQTCRNAFAELAKNLDGFVYANADGNIVIAAYPTATSDTVDLDRMIDSPALSGTASGYEYQAGTIKFMGDQRWCPEDAVEIEIDEITYMIPCMYIEHFYDGGLTTTITAPSSVAEDNTGSIQAAVEKLEDEVAVSGMRCKQVATDDGGSITYFYNATTLAESTGVIRISDQGIQFTSEYTGDDDTTTWYGLDLSGDLLAAIISASGLTLGGKDNGNGTLTVLDESGNTIATINSDGITSTVIEALEEELESQKSLYSQLQQLYDSLALQVTNVSENTSFEATNVFYQYTGAIVPELTTYPTTKFYVYDVCSDTLYCADNLMCGTNDYENHVGEIYKNTGFVYACADDLYCSEDILCGKYAFYRFTETDGAYSWELLTDEEAEALVDRSSYVKIELEQITILSSSNGVTSKVIVSPDGIIIDGEIEEVKAKTIYCC